MASAMERLNMEPFEYWLAIWHEHRTAILLSTVFALLILRTWLHMHLSRVKHNQSPFSTSSSDPPPLREKEEASLKQSDVKGALFDKSETKTRRRQSPKRVTGHKSKRIVDVQADIALDTKVQSLIFYASIGGTTEATARRFQQDLQRSLSCSDHSSRYLQPELHNLAEVDYEEYFTSLPPNDDAKIRYFYVFLLPSYDIDSLIDSFIEHLQETHNDFRIDTAPLSSVLGYAVFGFGDGVEWPSEAEGFCSQAREVDRWMARLTGRKRAFPLGMGNVLSDALHRLDQWRVGVTDVLREIAIHGGLGEGVMGSGEPLESDEEDSDDGDDGDDGEDDDDGDRATSAKIDDLEDLGGTVRTVDERTSTSSDPIPIDFTTYSSSVTTPAVPRPTIKEMVPRSSPTHTALTKQGYTIVGSHSGVKICRWTKSALRGRGSCYKYSFYGIASHLCMETTPSLSCSNKCVFCWRHGTNPVGTTWRWKVDPPDAIFAGVKAGHYQKIKMLRGVPGVRADRFAEAFQIRHCALSLVGEPIFYPHINEFTALLHREHISSFLVCNAQHPDQLAALRPVTQLYVSIDASNRESLRRIDRPLHRDFWERFQRCLAILRDRRHTMRTVFRLTLVKDFNIADEIDGYAELIATALPCFVEIKGVTFCGTSTSAAAGVRMQNVPFYHEVKAFAEGLDQALCKRGLAYGLAAEHQHSCCILLASERFRVDGKWCTRIDYRRFFHCLESGDPFSPEDYMDRDPTPDWTTWGSGGFDPRDTRVKTKGKGRTRFVDGVPIAVDRMPAVT